LIILLFLSAFFPFGKVQTVLIFDDAPGSLEEEVGGPAGMPGDGGGSCVPEVEWETLALLFGGFHGIEADLVEYFAEISAFLVDAAVVLADGAFDDFDVLFESVEGVRFRFN
jgi:hypothetical protein